MRYAKKYNKRSKPRNRRRLRKTKRNLPGNKMVVSQTAKYNTPQLKPLRICRTQHNILLLTGASSTYSVITPVIPNAMPDWSSCIGLYNRYMLNSITVTLTLVDPTPTSINFTDTRLPEVFIRYNYDSNLSTVTASYVGQLTNISSLQMTDEKTRLQYKCYPHTIQQVYLSAVATGYELQKKRWIDVNYGAVPHYGYLIYMDFLATGLSINVDLTYDMSFKYSM